MRVLSADKISGVVHGVDYTHVTFSYIIKVLLGRLRTQAIMKYFFLHKYFWYKLKETAKEYIVVEKILLGRRRCEKDHLKLSKA